MDQLYFNAVLMLVSLCGMVFIVVMKIAEIRGSRVGVLSKVSAKGDPIISKWLANFKWLLDNVNFNNIKKIGSFVSRYIFHFFGTMGIFVHKNYKVAADRIKGKRHLTDSESHEPVSFFLKDVAESRGEEKKDL